MYQRLQRLTWICLDVLLNACLNHHPQLAIYRRRVASDSLYAGVAVQNVQRSRTSKVSGLCQRLAVHDEGLRFTSRHRGRCAEKWQELKTVVCNVGGRNVGRR